MALLGVRVKALRERQGLNQSELAEACSLTSATISRIESGRVQELKSEALKSLASALHVTMDYLAGRSDQMRPEEIRDADPQARSILAYYNLLSKEKRDALERYAWFLLFEEKVGQQAFSDIWKRTAAEAEKYKLRPKSDQDEAQARLSDADKIFWDLLRNFEFEE